MATYGETKRAFRAGAEKAEARANEQANVRIAVALEKIADSLAMLVEIETVRFNREMGRW